MWGVHCFSCNWPNFKSLYTISIERATDFALQNDIYLIPIWIEVIATQDCNIHTCINNQLVIRMLSSFYSVKYANMKPILYLVTVICANHSSYSCPVWHMLLLWNIGLHTQQRGSLIHWDWSKSWWRSVIRLFKPHLKKPIIVPIFLYQLL